MALGALIGAYQEDDGGGLRALLPLSGRTLFEYQARCVAAVGAAPIVVLVERLPPALQGAIERLRAEQIVVTPVSGAAEAASRFEADGELILLADGVAADMSDLVAIAEADGPLILTVADDEAHAGFERIDSTRRWAGAARIDAGLLGATAAMLGDWDLQSTLLRRAIQAGVPLAASSGEGGGPLLAEDEAALAGLERRLLVASRGARDDWVARYLLPIIEEIATERLLETRVRPQWLAGVGVGLTVAAAFAFTRGWLWPALVLLLLSLPLDLVARRLAVLRLRPLPTNSLALGLLWPAAGLALIALAWFISRHGDGGWGAGLAALTAAAFAEAARIERGALRLDFGQWLFSRRAAIVAALPFAIVGAWNLYLALLALYAAVSFFLVQHVRHRDSRAFD